MKNKILKMFSSNVRIRVRGKNIENFIRRLIRNKINIIRVIPVSYKEVDLIIDYNDFEKILKYKTIYDIEIKRYFGKLNILKFFQKNIFIFTFLIVGLVIIFLLSNIIFSVEVIHSNSTLKKIIYDELEERGIKKYSFVKGYNEIEKIEKEILENNKDNIEWLEIIRKGTKYIVRVEERIINKEKDDNRVYNIVSSKNAIIKKMYIESGVKVKEVDTYVKKGETIISSEIILPNNDKKNVSSSGKVLGEVWYNVSIDFPYRYYEVSYTGRKRRVLIFSINKYKIPFFKYSEYKSFDKDIKYIFKNNISPSNLYFEYQYETRIIDTKYNYEEAKKVAIEKVKEKLKKKNNKIEGISKIIIVNEKDNFNKISLNLFVNTIEDITEYMEVKEEYIE